jgi:hypothetical protein
MAVIDGRGAGNSRGGSNRPAMLGDGNDGDGAGYLNWMS